MAEPPPYDGVVLAGGRARRMGGVAKPLLEVGGQSLLDVALAALEGAVTRVVVGPDAPEGVVRVQEDPPGGGPVAALVAALPLLTAPVVVVLAGDLPFVAAEHVTELVRAAPAMAVDDEGRDQPLLAAYLTADLEAAVRGAGPSMRSVTAQLEPLARVTLPGQPWFDLDTPEDLELVRRTPRA